MINCTLKHALNKFPESGIFSVTVVMTIFNGEVGSWMLADSSFLRPSIKAYFTWSGCIGSCQSTLTYSSLAAPANYLRPIHINMYARRERGVSNFAYGKGGSEPMLTMASCGKINVLLMT